MQRGNYGNGRNHGGQNRYGIYSERIGNSFGSCQYSEVFQSGANGAISGDMLTTSGITIDEDMKLLRELRYEVKDVNKIRTAEAVGEQ